MPAQFLPRHVALVMDGNGRWARQRGLPRTEGHRAGEAALLDVLHGAIEIGVTTVSAYAFSTENWRRTPEEVRFLMGFNKEVIRRRRDELGALGVRIRWAGRRPQRRPALRSFSRKFAIYWQSAAESLQFDVLCSPHRLGPAGNRACSEPVG